MTERKRAEEKIIFWRREKEDGSLLFQPPSSSSLFQFVRDEMFSNDTLLSSSLAQLQVDGGRDSLPERRVGKRGESG